MKAFDEPKRRRKPKFRRAWDDVPRGTMVEVRSYVQSAAKAREKVVPLADSP
jgi:hypothetical protein